MNSKSQTVGYIHDNEEAITISVIIAATSISIMAVIFFII